MKKLILAILVVTWFVTGCSTFPKDDITVESEANPKVNFSAYKTYAWLAAIGIVEDADGVWETPKFDADGEIQLRINDALRSKGMRVRV